MGVLPGGWREVQSRLRAAVMAGRDPREVAGSFAFALFLIALPNLGVSLVVLGAIAYRVDIADPRAFSAAALILNPLTKGGIYVVGFALGSYVLGPVPGGFTGFDPEIGRQVLARLLLGNLLIAWTAAIVGYYLVLWLIRQTRLSPVPSEG